MKSWPTDIILRILRETIFPYGRRTSLSCKPQRALAYLETRGVELAASLNTCSFQRTLKQISSYLSKGDSNYKILVFTEFLYSFLSENEVDLFIARVRQASESVMPPNIKLQLLAELGFESM